VSHAKVGRNDRCPCGSGTKFKHCCLAPSALTSAPFLQGATASDRVTFSREGRRVLSGWASQPQEVLDGRTPLEVLSEPGGFEKIPVLMDDLHKYMARTTFTGVNIVSRTLGTQEEDSL
jgi:hypothetical protein